MTSGAGGSPNRIASGCQKNSGFTLIELSIVLSVIGLLVAGVTIGSKMIASAQNRALIRDISYYKSAVDDFKTTYDAMPGDFTNAYNLWGSLPGANSCTNDQVVTVSSGCNGDGNEIIDSGFTEDMRAWQHLQLAGFIPGAYPGTAPSSNPVAGVNIPAGAISASAYALDSFDFYGRSGNGFRLVNAGDYNKGALSAAKAYDIDSKIDDGLANKGNIYTVRGSDYSNPSCVNDGDYSYNLSDANISCRMFFYLE